jgi:hypothetical protein
MLGAMARRPPPGATALLWLSLAARLVTGGETQVAAERDRPEIFAATGSHRALLAVARTGDPARTRRPSTVVPPAGVPASLRLIAPDRILAIIEPAEPATPRSSAAPAPIRARAPPPA